VSQNDEEIRSWIQRHRFSFELLEDPGAKTAPVTVLEKESGKGLSFPLGAIARLEEDRDSVRGSSYLRVMLEDGRSFALSSAGFVFAPSFVSTGPLPDCPPAASLVDFRRLFGHLVHLVEEVSEGHEAEALQVILVLIAFIDGARQIGLQVSEEERMLDAQLGKLEARGVSVGGPG
jgi:hypothetical protein